MGLQELGPSLHWGSGPSGLLFCQDFIFSLLKGDRQAPLHQVSSLVFSREPDTRGPKFRTAMKFQTKYGGIGVSGTRWGWGRGKRVSGEGSTTLSMPSASVLRP